MTCAGIPGLTCAGDMGRMQRLCTSTAAVLARPLLDNESALLTAVTCPECVARLAMVFGTAAPRCPYCRLPWGEEHAVDAPMVGCPLVTKMRGCSICTAMWLLGELVPVYEPDGRLLFECTTCREEHPRSGRYSFGERARGAMPAARSGAGGAQ